MSSLNYLRELQVLEEAMEEAVSTSSQTFGSVIESEFTQRLHKMMYEVKDLIEEVQDEMNE